MPQLIPPQPAFASDAERVVWDVLAAQLPHDATMIAGQRITDDAHEVEIDLLVLWPGIGTVVIEVKGGRVGVEDGTWFQRDRSGRRALHPSPVEQAQRARHVLLRHINERSSRPLGRSVHMVALPWSQLPDDWDVPDAPRALMLDAMDLGTGGSGGAGSGGAVERIVAALRSHGGSHLSPLEGVQRDHAVRTLRRTEAAIENHQLLARQIEDSGNQLTREQERILALLRFQHRAQVVGGAGSGKTHLALMKARALTREGRRTALMCYSRGLARHFQLLTATWPAEDRPAYVGLFHDLPVRWGAQTEEEFDGTAVAYYEEFLPAQLRELASTRPVEDLFEAIVVDEAQDFADLWWDALRPCLVEPEDTGASVLFVFTDAHQSVFDRDGRAPITLSPFPLDDNLRNTRTIAETFAPLTPLEQNPRMEEGAPVRFVACATEDAISTADDLIDPLLDEGWEPGEIALLTTGRRHPEQRERIDYAGYSGYWDEFFAATDVFYGHVLNFKGLERRVVVLAVNGFQHWERSPHLMYVGLSRARSLLVVVGDPELIRTVVGDQVADRLIGAGGGAARRP
ncbi:NERD domain-containing protein [Brachybacterium sp. p3-SID1565]|uniref:NERD domain-containing protein n=1 Tax=Brachybacterium epidermidis TaxID=2781983 RepID=A0ABR9VYA2_9MICO|nr:MULTISPECIES: NERD domain-containing protein [Brachybacterium]MBE9403166.1 NERD domain-containing protein [Brachybacterium epidermidis]MCT1385751.1 NERD domain-containing protein [Brachybacterium sp. p3-SID1565]